MPSAMPSRRLPRAQSRNSLAQAWGNAHCPRHPPCRWSSAFDQAFLLSGIGMMAVLVKGVAGVYASSVQGQMGGEVGSDLRLRALDALLSVSSGVPSATWRSGGALDAPRDAFALSAPTEHGCGSSSMQLRDCAAGARWIFAMHRTEPLAVRTCSCVSIATGPLFSRP